MKVKNFLFHRVSPEKDLMWPPIEPARFENIIRVIKKKYNVVLLEDFLQSATYKTSEKTFATILFDDGYKDNFEFAAPVLQKYNCPASFYIVTECIDKGVPTWTYIIDLFFKICRDKELILQFNFVPATFQFIQWQTIMEAKFFSGRLKTWMKSLSNDNRKIIMKTIGEKFNGLPFPSDLMMNWNEVRQLYNQGFYIGSHSHTHPLLASISNEDEIEKELQLSAIRIKSQLGYQPVTISYPIGSWDERVVRLAKENGYQFGLAVEQKQYDTVRNDKLIIPRMELYMEPWWKTRLRINGLYQSAKRVLR